MILITLTKLYVSMRNLNYKVQGVKTRLFTIGAFQYVIKGKANDPLLDNVKKHFFEQECTS